MMNFIIEPVVGYQLKDHKIGIIADRDELATRIISTAEFLASEFDRNCTYYSYSPLGLLLDHFILPDFEIEMFPKNLKLDGFVMLTYPFNQPGVNHRIDCTITALMEQINPLEDYHNVIPLQEGYFEIELPDGLYKAMQEALQNYEDKIESCYKKNEDLLKEFNKNGHLLAVKE